MTPKASTTSQTLVKFKSPGPVQLIFDGAHSHLDANIVIAVEAHAKTVYCLPSINMHELQPLDKSIFKPYESYWDEEVMLFWKKKKTQKVVVSFFQDSKKSVIEPNNT
ncbi:hypothetical protein PR048_006154 [Dryococelus australis]|uniref:DDE-1 domain-containing protein n=1 Tax=Dryococelus australis TaxID=614101 RepID=A0ABQ9IA66_9NEOP|nr:hypothetical protein PR048_006154 [Dryococelus australis]